MPYLPTSEIWDQSPRWSAPTSPCPFCNIRGFISRLCHVSSILTKLHCYLGGCWQIHQGHPFWCLTLTIHCLQGCIPISRHNLQVAWIPSQSRIVILFLLAPFGGNSFTYAAHNSRSPLEILWYGWRWFPVGSFKRWNADSWMDIGVVG